MINVRCLQALEHGDQETAGLGDAFTELTGHISDAASLFFQHWLHLVDLEEAPGAKRRAEIWNKTGTCMSAWILVRQNYATKAGLLGKLCHTQQGFPLEHS